MRSIRLLCKTPGETDFFSNQKMLVKLKTSSYTTTKPEGPRVLYYRSVPLIRPLRKLLKISLYIADVLNIPV